MNSGNPRIDMASISAALTIAIYPLTIPGKFGNIHFCLKYTTLNFSETYQKFCHHRLLIIIKNK